MGGADSIWYQQPSNCPSSMSLTGSVISSHSGQGVTLGKCGMLCEKESACKSYNAKDGYCELNSEETNEYSQGMLLGDMTYMEKVSQTIDKKCKDGASYSLTLSADDAIDDLWVNGVQQAPGPRWRSYGIPDVHEWFVMNITGKHLISLKAHDYLGGGWFLAISFLGVHIQQPVKCGTINETGWQNLDFDDSNWPVAYVALNWNTGWPKYHPNITRLWAAGVSPPCDVYCRFYVAV